MTLDQIALKHHTDKSSRIHNYTSKYSEQFSKLRNKKIKILEIGIQNGASLKMWRDYFSKAEVYGLDIIDCSKFDSDRIKTIRGSQNDLNFLKQVNDKHGPFDIIIDDGSHVSSDMRISFDSLFPLLIKGGIYVVEDLNCCYRWQFKENSYNFMDRLKELLDIVNSHGKCGIAEPNNIKNDLFYQSGELGKLDWWDQSIESIQIWRSIVFIKKSEIAPKPDKSATVSPPLNYLKFKKKIKYLIADTGKLFKSSWKTFFENQFQSKKEIEEYRKTIKIYDVVTFFNEFELLEIRFNMLYPHVDYFVIKESKQTFSGQPKKLLFKENRNRFKQFEDKIIYFETDDSLQSEADLKSQLKNKNLSDLKRSAIKMALTSDNVPKGESHWLRDFYQKELLKIPLKGLNDDDICFIGDVDEIWNPEAIIDFRKDDIFKLRQIVFAYYFNNRSSEPWAGTLVTKYKNIKNSCLNHLRTPRKTKYTYIKNGGWHFTNMGGEKRVIEKIESYSHQEINTDEIKKSIKDKMEQNKDFMGRSYEFKIDDSELPKYILKNRFKYRKLFNSKH